MKLSKQNLLLWKIGHFFTSAAHSAFSSTVFVVPFVFQPNLHSIPLCVSEVQIKAGLNGRC